MKTIIRCAAVFLALLSLTGCVKPVTDPTETTVPSENPTTSTPTAPAQTGWVTEGGKTYYFLRDGSFMTGKVQIGESTYYFDNAGVLQTGWVTEGDKKFYFGTDGAMLTGWVTIDEKQYYFRPNGTMAQGQVQIDGKNHFFTAAGTEVLVVNPWNAVPDGYDPDLVTFGEPLGKAGSQVSRVCYDPLVQMMNDCNAIYPTVYVISSYRSYDYQAGLFENRIQRFQNEGYSRAEAEKLAATVVAKPGTSEHHLGLAVDIIDTRSWDLTEIQETLPGQQWLMENCWRYGFILRYPKGTTDSTGIIYEPWHYRYVGLVLAKELHESKLTLEQYLENLTE